MLSDDLIERCNKAIVECIAFGEFDRASRGDNPEPRSIAWNEFFVLAAAEHGSSSDWATETTARSAHAVGALAVMASTQTLFALSQLIRPKQQIAAFGFEVMARTVLEASARAWWIYEPFIDLRVRVARAKTVELFSVNEGVKAERRFSEDTKNFTKERDRIINEAQKLGLRFDLSKLGELVGFEDQRRPDATPIIEDMLSKLGLRDAAKLVYPLYSAVDHATVYAMIRSLMTLRTTKTTATVSPQVTNNQIATASVIALSAHLGVLGRRAFLYGFNHLEIDAKRFALCGPILELGAKAGP